MRFFRTWCSLTLPKNLLRRYLLKKQYFIKLRVWIDNRKGPHMCKNVLYNNKYCIQ